MRESTGQTVQLDAPPIVEVVCGFHFDLAADLDPVVLAEFRAEHRDEYPRHRIQPPLGDAPVAITPGGDLRIWMVSADDRFVVQVQRDRLYLNWRRPPNGTYPRFSSRNGTEGVCARALREFQGFEEFCNRRLGARPEVRRCELAKVDHFIEGTHWRSIEDLVQLLPVAGLWTAIGGMGEAVFHLQLQRPLEGGIVTASLASAEHREVGGKAQRAVVLQTQAVVSLEGSETLEGAFERANARVNEVFFSAVPREQLGRFQEVSA